MAARGGDAVVFLGRFPFFLRCGVASFAAGLQSFVDAALLGGAKTRETPRKTAGQNFKLMAKRRDYSNIPPKMEVFAPSELEPEQLSSSWVMGYDEPVDRPLADS